MTRMKLKRRAFAVLAIVGIMLLGTVLVWSETRQTAPDYKQLSLFRKVMEIVEKNYVKEVTGKELMQGALNGMLQSLDPHSSFLKQESLKELQVETKGEFDGLGIEITLDSGVLTVVTPIEDSPADKAGIKPGDKIIKINGETTKNISLIKAVKLMRGPKGTTVTITVMREGFRKFKDYTIARDVIHVHAVRKELIEPGYPYIRVASFQQSTDDDLVSAIKQFGGDEKIKGLVLDLRNNPGGLLDQAVRVAQHFIDKGRIVYTDGRVKDQQMEFRANSAVKHYNFKMAVLINEGSASASEIVAGAVQDHDRGLIVGTKSFGKASVQTIIPMDDGTGLRLTTAYYYTPLGRHIQKTGIEPDVDLKEQLQKQREQEQEEESKTKDKDQAKPNRFQRPTVDLEKDQVLRAAFDWLKSDVTVKQYKQEHKKKEATDKAAQAEK